MTKQKTVRLSDELDAAISLLARVQDKSENQIIIDALNVEISRVRADQEFMVKLTKHVERDKEILDRLAQ
ncbi:MAG: hypothetical protein WCO08_04240 [Actinomycetes bacterium]